MIKKTLYFGNPAYLSLRNAQLVIRLPEVVKNDTLPEHFKQEAEVTKAIEDIGVVILDNKQRKRGVFTPRLFLLFSFIKLSIFCDSPQVVFRIAVQHQIGISDRVVEEQIVQL